MLLFEKSRGKKILAQDSAPDATDVLWQRTTGASKLFAYQSTFWEAMESIPFEGNRAGSGMSNEYAGWHRFAATNANSKALYLPYPALITNFSIHAGSAGNISNYANVYVNGSAVVSLGWSSALVHATPNYLVTSADYAIAIRKIHVTIPAITDWWGRILYREVVIP